MDIIIDHTIINNINYQTLTHDKSRQNTRGGGDGCPFHLVVEAVPTERKKNWEEAADLEVEEEDGNKEEDEHHCQQLPPAAGVGRRTEVVVVGATAQRSSPHSPQEGGRR
jgi:hypothetical protein